LEAHQLEEVPAIQWEVRHLVGSKQYPGFRSVCANDVDLSLYGDLLSRGGEFKLHVKPARGAYCDPYSRALHGGESALHDGQIINTHWKRGKDVVSRPIRPGGTLKGSSRVDCRDLGIDDDGTGWVNNISQ
jgi:hypothetical protein